MPSVFQGAQSHNGGFRADQLTLTLGGVDVRGFLIQNIQFSYTQQLTLLYEIGSEFVYYVGGRAQGTSTIARILGPQAAGGDFLNRYTDLCEPQDMEFNASAGCAGAGTGAGRYTIIDAVLTTISVSVTSQEVVINEQLQFIFIDLETPAGGGV